MRPERVTTFLHAGYACLVTRNPVLGTLCGYVLVPEQHPWYGRKLGELDEVEVHGGVTWAALDDDEPTLWRVGFDCSHADDGMPGLMTKVSPDFRHYATKTGDPIAGPPRSLEYVQHECRRLAEQAVAATTCGDDDK